ncbi:MAG: segregation/condensation protein A [Deltaproteobacteria bacterium]|jgi:segregation and condensation protein A|nr:segregation/condensation protein A [Deltaproteobacteria bacterium]
MTLHIASDDYRVNLEIFEGPLDLLIHLIKKNDLDVYDIPVAFVLEEYMKYLDTLKELDIDLAGDFLLMAAEMAHIKSKLLLPDEELEEEEMELDPRSDLVKRLLEYQQFKEASHALVERKMLGRDEFVQQAYEKIETPNDGPMEGDVYELIEAFSKILKKAPQTEFHDVSVDRISINDRIYQVIGMIKKGMTVMLDDLVGNDYSKYNIVITFLALLEMSKLRMIKVYQSSTCGPVHIQGVMEEVDDEDVARLIEVETSSYDGKESKEEQS